MKIEDHVGVRTSQNYTHTKNWFEIEKLLKIRTFLCMWHNIVWCKSADVSEEITASNFRDDKK